MTASFWFLAGVLTTLAFLVLAWPVLDRYRGRETFAKLPLALLIGAAFVPVAAIGLYLKLGRPDMVLSSALPHAGMPGAPGATNANASTMQSAVTGLELRLAAKGGTDADWELLAKSYDFMGRTADAALARAHQLAAGESSSATSQAAFSKTLSGAALKSLQQAETLRLAKKYSAASAIYARLAASNELDADGWANYADCTATLNGGKLEGKPEAYVARALALEPRHAKALWLKASADEETGRWSAAVTDWQVLLSVLPPDSGDAKLVGESLRQAVAQSGKDSIADQPRVAASSGGVPNNSGSVTGEVVLAEAVKARISKGLTLFIVAKSIDSPGAPVAVLRLSTDQWPVHFTLDDSLAMVPGRTLSAAGRVLVEARISHTGQAAAVSGDMSGSTSVVDPKSGAPIRITIDKIVP